MPAVQRTWHEPGLWLATVPLGLIIAVFFLIPLGMTVALSFQNMQFYRLVWTWDLEIWRDIFSQGYYWRILLRTVVMALICVALCVLISLPVAYALVNRLRTMQNHVKLLIVFAFLTDAVLKTFGWVLFLDPSGILNGTLHMLGFPPRSVNVLFTPTATVIGMVYNLLPYTIFTIFLSLDRVERDLVLAAYDAGATRVRTFWEVTLPLARPGIVAGSVLVFVLSLGVFLEPRVMGGGTSPMAAELIRQTFETRVNWPLGAALTLVLIVMGALVLATGAFAAWLQMRRTKLGEPE